MGSRKQRCVWGRLVQGEEGQVEDMGTAHAAAIKASDEDKKAKVGG